MSTQLIYGLLNSRGSPMERWTFNYPCKRSIFTIFTESLYTGVFIGRYVMRKKIMRMYNEIIYDALSIRILETSKHTQETS